MNWEQFHYLCRAYSLAEFEHRPRIREFQKLPEIQAALAEYRETPSAKKQLNEPVLEILSKMEADAEKEFFAAQLYAKTNFAAHLRKVSGLFRIRAYFVLLAAAFIVMSTTYSVFVYPTISTVFAELEPQVGVQAEAFIALFPWLSIGMIVLIMASFLWSNRLSKAAAGRLSFEKISTAFWATSKLKIIYGDIHKIMNYPLITDRNNIASVVSYVVDPKNTGVELDRLFEYKCRIMHLESERVLRWIVGIIGIFIAASIYFFIASAYAPIFRMGSIL